MSEKNNDATPVMGATSVMRVDNKDWFLQNLIRIVNLGTGTFPITLNVGGFLASGILIGGKEYFENFGTDFAGMFPPGESANNIKESIAQYGDIYTLDKYKQESKIGYIHLKNARFFNTSGNPIPVSNKGVLWRGRIEEVSGFCLGLLSNENPDSGE